MQLKYPEDPTRDLYPTCGEAHAAGRWHGIDDALSGAIDALGAIYLKHELALDNVRFSAVGECLTKLREIRRDAWTRNKPAAQPVEGSG